MKTIAHSPMLTRAISVLPCLLLAQLAPGTTTRAQDTLAWVRTYDSPGQSFDWAWDLAVSPNGNVHVTGLSPTGATVKYSPTGTPLWAEPAPQGGSGISIGVDAYDNVYITGSSSAGLHTWSFDSAGIVRWNRLLGPAGLAGRAVRLDGLGNVLVAGDGGVGVRLVKYDTAGNFLWSQEIGGRLPNRAQGLHSLAVDQGGSAYIASNSPTHKIAKYGPDGSQFWTGLSQGADLSRVVHAVKVDSNGNPHILLSDASFEYAVVVKLEASGAEMWRHIIYANDGGSELSLEVDPFGSCYVLGGHNPRYLTKYDTNGDLVWQRYFGSEGLLSTDLSVDSMGLVYVGFDGVGVGVYDGSGTLLWSYAYLDYPDPSWVVNIACIAPGPGGALYMCGRVDFASENDYLTLRLNVPVIPIDSDVDGVLDVNDNCPVTFNPGQSDTDGDGIGDICEGGDTLTTSCESHMVLSPSGTVPFRVTVRDNAGNPVSGSTNVWLDFSRSSELIPCHPAWPIITPAFPSGPDGTLIFFPAVGGSTPDSVEVRSSHGLIAAIPVKSLDRNGSMYVSPLDFDSSPACDYNDDGVTDYTDWQFHGQNVGAECAGYGQGELVLLMAVGASLEYSPGDSLSVCARVINIADAPKFIDSIVFLSADYGIGQPWTAFAAAPAVPCGGLDTVNVCRTFVYPNSAHVCFRIALYEGAPVPTLMGSSTDPQGSCRPTRLNMPIANVCRLSTPNYGVYQRDNLIQGVEVAVDDNGNPCNCEGAEITEKVRFAFEFASCLPGQPVYTGFRMAVLLDENNMARCPNSRDPLECGTYASDACVDRYTGLYFRHQIPLGASSCTEALNQELFLDGQFLERRLLLYTAILGADGNVIVDLDVTTLERRVFSGRVRSCKKVEEKQRNTRGRGMAPPPTTQKVSPDKSRAAVRLGSTLVADYYEIPIGNEYGDTLTLSWQAFLPDGWMLDADTGLTIVVAPDTVSFLIYHPEIVGCLDTGRVVVSALVGGEEYVGHAEVVVQTLGQRGDITNDGFFDVRDVVRLVDYTFRGSPPPSPLDPADVNDDGIVDVTDVVSEVNIVFRGGPSPCGVGS